MDYAASVEMHTLTVDSLTEIRASLPDAAEMTPDAAAAYVALLGHLDSWSVLAAAALEELERWRPELQPVTVERAGSFADGDPGPPAALAN